MANSLRTSSVSNIIPKHWTTSSLSDIAKLVPSPNKIPKKLFLESGKYPIVSQEQQYINGYWNIEKDVIKISTPITIFGDHTKTIKYIDFDFVYGADGIQILQPLSHIAPKFLYYLIYSTPLRDLGYARHFKLLKKIEFPVPPLEEQKEIVAKLDSAFERLDHSLENCKQALKLIKELWQSSLDRALSPREAWATKTLGDSEICKIERGSSPRPIKDFITNDSSGINWIKIGDTNLNEKYVWSTAQKITITGAEKSRYVYKGDFILSNSMSFGRPYIMKIVGCIHDGWFVIRLSKYINQDWFYYLLLSPTIQNQIHGLAQGSTVQNISSDLIKKVCIPVPLLEEQKEIVAKLDKINDYIKKLESDYTNKTLYIKELKSSLLNDAFTGKLTNKE